MNAKRFAIGTLAGGVTVIVIATIIYPFLFANFFARNVGSATGVARDSVAFVPLCLGQLVYGALLTQVIGGWAKVSTAVEGAKVGVVVGMLVFLGVGLIQYGTTNVSNLTATLVNPIVGAIQMGVAGAVVAAVLRKV